MRAKKPRVLMFAPYCYPANQSEAIVNAKFLLAAREAEWELDVISGLAARARYPVENSEVWQPIAQIVRTIDSPIGWSSASLLGRMWAAMRTGDLVPGLSWARRALAIAERKVSKVRYDLILSRSNPACAHLPALAVSRRTGVPWVANWNDPRPSVKCPAPYGHGPSAPIPWPVRKYLDSVSRHAAWHTFPCERLRRYVCSYLPARVFAKSSAIPHVALRRFRVRSRTAPGVFSLCHAGNLRPPREPYVLLEGIRRFLVRARIHGDFCVRFVGDQPGELGSMAESLGLGHLIRVEGTRGYEHALRVMAAANVLVVVEAQCEEGVFLPAKFVDYVQTGRPILALSPVVGTLGDILSQHGGGIAVDNRSPAAVANALATLYDHWKHGTLDATYGSARLFPLFSEERVLGLYTELFDRLARGDRTPSHSGNSGLHACSTGDRGAHLRGERLLSIRGRAGCFVRNPVRHFRSLPGRIRRLIFTKA